MEKEARMEKAASISGTREMGQLHVKNEIRTFSNTIQKWSQNGSRPNARLTS